MNDKLMDMRISQWMPLFEAQTKSGLTKGKWCDENGIRRWEFFQRQREIRSYLIGRETTIAEVKDFGREKDLPSFVELPMKTTDPLPEIDTNVHTQPEEQIELTYKGFKAKLSSQINADTLERLISAVSHVQ